MVPLWLFLAVTLVLGLITLALIYLHFIRNPLPFPDWGNAIFVCPNQRAWEALLQALRQKGKKPDRRAKTALANRAIFFSHFRFIVNVTQESAWEELGKPVAGLALVVKDPVKEATSATDYLMLSGFNSYVFPNPDPDVPSGAMAFVTSTAFPGWILVFRKHFTKMGPPPPKWTDEPLSLHKAA
jgi:hypothetical protein